MIKLTKLMDPLDPIWVSPSYIIAIEAISSTRSYPGAIVHVAHRSPLEVNEQPEEILRLMRGIDPETGSTTWFTPHGDNGPSYGVRTDVAPMRSGFVK